MYCLLVIGASGSIKNKTVETVCRFLGDISYPIYITHYPFIYIYTAWVSTKKPTTGEIIPVAVGIFVASLVVAYVALKLYDEPVRKYLRNKMFGQSNAK